jgi:alpha-ketoglutarate-dependent taurine dioxygenase
MELRFRYRDVVARTFGSSERRVSVVEEQTPLVIEPKETNSGAFLSHFLSAHSSEIEEDIALHGAVLLRGFDVQSTLDFERHILSIRCMKGINEVLMSEPGRTVVDGATFALHTNKNFKTGGTLDRVGGFHVENYYVPDVPRFISFFCNRPSWLGGETGLVNMAKLYAELPSTLQQKLEAHTFLARKFSTKEVEERYNIPRHVLEIFFAEYGMNMSEDGSAKSIQIFKPAVLQHPSTGEKCLAINVSSELNRFGLSLELTKNFSQDYLGWNWALHRLAWRRRYVELLANLIEQPRVAWSYIYRLLIDILGGRLGKYNSITHGPLEPLVGDVFNSNEIKLVASLMRRFYSSFSWRKGDILIVDNLKMAHAGMPGLGPRDLKALICNAVSVPYMREARGLYEVRADSRHQTLGERLVSLSGRKSEVERPTV